jgi:SAM-dependent methyltransferase
MKVTNSWLRPIHPFPARMASSIAQKRLQSRKRLSVLDPMAGSGTTVVAARLSGHRALGFDTDPLALTIAKAWTTDVNANQIREQALKVLAEAKRNYRKIRQSDAYPSESDNETRKFIRYWFDPTNRRQLKALSRQIVKISAPSEKALLWSVFSRLIVTKDAGASLARDVSHSRPHRAYSVAPIRAFDKFVDALNGVLRGSHFPCGNKLPTAKITKADARNLPLKGESIDLVITSPPYLNAIDYLRGHKLSLVWMGHSIAELRKLRASNIGAEGIRPSVNTANVGHALKAMGEVGRLSARSNRMLTQYLRDMNSVLSEISRVLKPQGEAIVVVGNSTIRGVFLRNSGALARLASANGLHLRSTRKRPILENRRYLPPPGRKESGKSLRTRMREEVILEFTKQPKAA